MRYIKKLKRKTHASIILLFALLLSAAFVFTPEPVSAITVDDGFNPNVNSSVSSIAVQANGKILIGGQFITVGGTTRTRIARLNVDGSLDTSFNPNANSIVKSIAVQADGKILIGGGFTTIGGTTRNYIVRLNADGSLDAAFDPNANNYVNSITVQPDGKILIGGDFTTIGGITRNRIARLNADGSLDTAFNPNANNYVNSFALQADSKILICGSFTIVDGTPRNYIARLNADGSVDAGFNPNVASDYLTSVSSMAVQADEKILIGGVFWTIGGITRNRIARLNADGSLDTAFDPNANDYVNSIVVQADGKILIGGRFSTIGGVTRYKIAQLNADGSLDTAFIANATYDSGVNSIALQADGKILIGGYFTTIGGTTHNQIARLNSPEAALQELQVSDNTTVRWMRSGAGPELDNVWFESSPDMTSWTMLGAGSRISGGWEISGLNLPNIANIYIRARGYAKNGGDSTSIIESVRAVNLSGLPSYALSVTKSGTGSGMVTSSPAWIDCGAVCAVEDSNGITITLMATPLTGSTFTGWSGDDDCSDGIVTMDAAKSCTAAFTMNTYLLTVTKAGTGSGTVTSSPAGISCEADCSESYIYNTYVTLTATSSKGSTFTGWSGDADCSDGIVTMNAAKSCTASFEVSAVSVDYGFNPSGPFNVYSIAVQADGKILHGGYVSFKRLNTDGSVDTTFNPNINYADDAYGEVEVFEIAVQADGKILIGGTHFPIGGTHRYGIARLNADGSLDTAFNPGVYDTISSIALQADGKILTGGYVSFKRLNADGSVDAAFNPNANDRVSSIVVQADGKILIGGSFTTIGGMPRKGIARLNADGSLDTAFNPNVSGGPIAVQADGKILIGGGGIKRLNTDGSLDDTFNPNVGGSVISISIQADGKILIGGRFTTIGGITRNHIARLNADGSLDTAFDAKVNVYYSQSYVSITVVQADGKILIGGAFSEIDGTPRYNIARLISADAALQELQVSGNTTVRWMRSGAGPELDNVLFESSPDMTSWTMLGAGSRITGGWEISGLNLPDITNICIRARGFANNSGNSTSIIIESARTFNLSGLPGYTLSVTKSGTGSGTVTSSPAGIDCGSDCTESYDYGTAITLTATPAAGSTFTGWSGACAGTGACVVTMDAAKSVASVFALIQHTVTPSSSGNGTISPATVQTVDHGVTITFTLTPSADYHIDNVTGECGGTLSGSIYTTNAITASCTVVANFAADVPNVEVPGVDIDLNAGWNLMGWITDNGYYIGATAPTSSEYAYDTDLAQVASIDAAMTDIGLSSADYMLIIGPGGKVHIPGSPFNTLNKLLPDKAYWIYANQDITITLPGNRLSKAATSTLATGWVQIGYRGDEGLSPENAMRCIDGNYNIVISGKGKLYVKGSPFNTLTSLHQGQGYFIYMTTNGLLTYECP